MNHIEKDKQFLRRKLPDIDQFSEMVNKLPENSKDFISYLSSQFLELDVYNRVKNDPEKVRSIVEQFGVQGVEKNDIADILAHFKLPPIPFDIFKTRNKDDFSGSKGK